MSSQPQDPATAPPSSDSSEPSNNQNKNTNAQETNPRFTALEAKKAALAQTLIDLKSQRHQLALQTKLPSGLTLPTTTPTGEAFSEDEILASALKSSNAVIKEHISLLHKYNEIKDVGQGLMGLIADKRDCRVVKVMEEFGIGEGD